MRINLGKESNEELKVGDIAFCEDVYYYIVYQPNNNLPYLFIDLNDNRVKYACNKLNHRVGDSITVDSYDVITRIIRRDDLEMVYSPTKEEEE